METETKKKESIYYLLIINLLYHIEFKYKSFY